MPHLSHHASNRAGVFALAAGIIGALYLADQQTSPSESSQSFYFPVAFSPSSTSLRIYTFENNLSVDLSNRLSPPTEFR